MKSAWSGIRQLTGMKKACALPDVQDVKKFCNDLNQFYARFDKFDFSHSRNELVEFHQSRVSEYLEISEDDILKGIRSFKAGKAGGPDRINSDVLKLCRAPGCCFKKYFPTVA